MRRTPRALEVDDLAEVAIDIFGEDRVHVAERLNDALDLAVARAESEVERGSGVLVTGSDPARRGGAAAAGPALTPGHPSGYCPRRRVHERAPTAHVLPLTTPRSDTTVRPVVTSGSRRTCGARRGCPVEGMTAVKKLINDPQTVVDESLEGFGRRPCRPRDGLRGPAFVTRADAPVPGKVGLVSGGGSGHEPLHGGFVGRGHARRRRARARCSPRPTPDQILPATQAVNAGAGVAAHREELHRRRAELRDRRRARAGRRHRGPHRPRQRRRRRRGLAVHGGPPRRGGHGRWSRRSPARPPSAATTSTPSPPSRERVNENVRTHGRRADRRAPFRTPACPASSCRGRDRDRHRHPRRARARHRIPMEPADGITDRLLDPVVDDLPFASGREVLLFVNGMGGTPLDELYIVYRRAAQCWRSGAQRGPARWWATTSPRWRCRAAPSRPPPGRRNDRLWDAPVHTAALRWGGDVSAGRRWTTAWARRVAIDWVRRGAAMAEHRVELIELDRRDRRRRPRREHGPRLQGRHGQARRADGRPPTPARR